MNTTDNRYAKALFQLSQEKNSLDDVYAALKEIDRMINALAEFREFLVNPLLSFPERETVLNALFKGKTPDLVLRFLLFVSYKKRINRLKEIIDAFDGLYLAVHNQTRVVVQTALALNDEDKKTIDARLQEKLHQQVLTQWQLTPDIIGGFRIFAKGLLYDYSFKSQLNNFRQSSTQKV